MNFYFPRSNTENRNTTGYNNWYLEVNLPLCKQLEERLHLCIELLHFEFCGEAMPIPVRSKNNFDKHIASSMQ